METMILACTCKHAFQDEQYGKGQRVHNWARKVGTSGAWRCTICKSLKQAKSPENATAEAPKS
jgi:hypothetical protein